MADLLKAYLELIEKRAGNGCATVWLSYLRAPMAAFNRDIDLTKLTFDYDVDNSFLYQFYPLKDRTDISLVERFVLTNENAYIYFCRTLNALAIALETGICYTRGPGKVSLCLDKGNIGLRYHWTATNGKERFFKHDLQKPYSKLKRMGIQDGRTSEIYEWVWKELESLSEREVA